MRYFIYCRKSSEAEDRQVASIESQLTTLKRSFADQTEIEIARVYEETFSAKAPGRPIFGQMIAEIEKGTADGIIAWAPDRLARNSIDGGRIVYLLDCEVIKDLKFATYTFENNSQGKFMLQIMFGQSKYYSDALSDNVKRGNRSKIEKGWRPSRAPLGYLNDRATRTIIKDPDRFHRVRQMFDLLLTGTYVPRQIWHIACQEWDFRTPRRREVGGRPIALSWIYRILKDPFYAGIIVWNGRTYPGAHEPVLSLDEFGRAQAILTKAEKPHPQKRIFAFTGMIRCGECGLLVTAEEKTNRHGSHYVYYHCTRRRIHCQCHQPSIRDAALECQIEVFLSKLAVPDRVHDWAKRGLLENRQTQERNHDEQKRFLDRRRKQTESSLASLISLRVRDLISDDEFIKERQHLELESLRVRQQTDTQVHTATTFEPLELLLSFRNRAIKLFRAGTPQTKRLIFGIAGSNPTLANKILTVQAKKPFRVITEDDHFSQLRAVEESIRTLWINRDSELLEIVSQLKTLETAHGIRLRDEPRSVA